jgi:hypothetical protein
MAARNGDGAPYLPRRIPVATASFHGEVMLFQRKSAVDSPYDSSSDAMPIKPSLNWPLHAAKN